METIYKNDDLLNLIWGNKYILDSVVTRFDIYMQEYLLCIDAYFTSFDRKFKKEVRLKIHFSDVIEYGFYHQTKYNFYNVEQYKFLITEQGYYISLDPVDETAMPSPDDQDFILSKNIEGVLYYNF